jgi:hypothetical protein
VDQDRRPDHRPHLPVLLTHLRTGTLDGVEYEIDLSAEHAEALRRALASFIGAARRGSGTGPRPVRGGRRAGASGLDTTEVREWAKAQGIEVKGRGRIPAEVVTRFKAATRR